MFTLRNHTQVSPEEHAYRRSASKISWQVTAVCAALVIVGGSVIFAFLFWQTTPAEANKPPQPNEIEVRLDPGELLLAAVLLAVGAILCAGVAARLIARRAVRPLDTAFQLQRRFVADASHELRTPLAVLTARLQQLAALIPPQDPGRPVVEELRQDTRTLADVVDALLGETSVPHRVLGSASLDSCASLDGTVAEVTRDLAQVAKQFGVALSSECPQITVTVPPLTLRRCLLALIDNAIDHSPAQGTVTVVGSQRGKTATVTVRDEGSGVEGISRSRIFTRFAQGDAPHTPRGKSTTNKGIGLALVRELCETHGGNVRLLSTGQEGTVFELTFPLAAEPSARGTS